MLLFMASNTNPFHEPWYVIGWTVKMDFDIIMIDIVSKFMSM